MQKFLSFVIAFLVTPALGGCLEPEDNRVIVEELGPFDFGRSPPSTTWYHYAGTLANPWPVDATNPSAVLNANITADLTGANIPYFTNATYYGTGFDTFEPTIGVTGSGAIFFTNWNGAGEGTHIIRSLDQGQSWEDVGPFLGGDDGGTGQTPNSNDPYIYVDKFTDRLVKFDISGGIEPVS